MDLENSSEGVVRGYDQWINGQKAGCWELANNSCQFDLPDFIDIFAPHCPSSRTLQSYAEKSYKPLIATEYCHTLGQSLEEHHEMWEVMQANDNLAGGAIWEWVGQGMPDRESEWPGKFAWTDSFSFTPDRECMLFRQETCISRETRWEWMRSCAP